jgi:sialic acid synthase
MVEVKITEDIKFGGNNPCFIIAEVGQNHQGDIEIAKKLIKAAKVSAIQYKFFKKKLSNRNIECVR